MAEDERRYTFPPLERRGVILGLGAPQLVVVAVVCVVCLAVVRAVPTVAGLLLCATAVGAAGVAVVWRVAGKTPSEWVPIAGAWGWRRRTREAVSDLPRKGMAPNRRVKVAPLPPLTGVELLSAHSRDGCPFAVVRDARAGTYAAAVAVRGRSFSLLEPSDKLRQLSAWGAVLSGLGREGSPIHRVQWVERAVPGDRDELRRYLAEREAALCEPSRDSYEALVGGAALVGHRHDVLLVIAVHRGRAGRAWRAHKGRKEAAIEVLRRELSLLQEQLHGAGLGVEKVLEREELAEVIRSATDPARKAPVVPAAGRPTEVVPVIGPPPRSVTSKWPMATDEGWSAYRADGAWHVTYWVEEWPRVEVGPDVLVPLLLGGKGCRATSLVMAPVAPGRAAREAEAARTADLADDELRRRAGFLSTARRRRQADGVARREAELADGHAEYRFSGYVTVTAAERAELDVACAEVEQAARRAHLELRRLYGQQEEAFTWTLPLARGLA